MMPIRLTRLILLLTLCSAAAACHTTSVGKAIGYPGPAPKSELWSD